MKILEANVCDFCDHIFLEGEKAYNITEEGSIMCGDCKAGFIEEVTIKRSYNGS